MAGVLQNAPTRETLIYYSTSIFSAREEEGKDFVHEISLLEGFLVDEFTSKQVDETDMYFSRRVCLFTNYFT